jgi:hypothetical protein
VQSRADAQHRFVGEILDQELLGWIDVESLRRCRHPRREPFQSA